MDAKNFEVTQLELADLLKVKDRTLRNLKREVPPKGKRGAELVYNLSDAITAWVEYKSSRKSLTEQDVAEARKRKELALALKEEALARSALVQAKKDEDKVVDIAEVQKEVETLFGRVRAKLRAIPNTLISAIVGLVGSTVAGKIKDLLESAIDQALAELASGKGDEDVSPEDSCGASGE